MRNELEIMAHAKAYLDKLANGVNPLTNEELPETDIVNQVRISRCLFYVSDVLRQVIENGGVNKKGKIDKIPFALAMGQIKKFRLIQHPVSISEITKQINSLRDNENMRKLSYRSITTFLVEEGLIDEYVDSQGKMKREPTYEGIKLGISTEKRTNYRGEYTAVLYNQNAQRYIVDHIERIIDIDWMRRERRDLMDEQKTETIDQETGEIIQE